MTKRNRCACRLHLPSVPAVYACRHCEERSNPVINKSPDCFIPRND
ncbi:MAG: hypothetical protein LBT42_01595 [Tannerella sp.]|nr:hypothetical protein [Tannerella sp.]